MKKFLILFLSVFLLNSIVNMSFGQNDDTKDVKSEQLKQYPDTVVNNDSVLLVVHGSQIWINGMPYEEYMRQKELDSTIKTIIEEDIASQNTPIIEDTPVKTRDLREEGIFIASNFLMFIFLYISLIATVRILMNHHQQLTFYQVSRVSESIPERLSLMSFAEPIIYAILAGFAYAIINYGNTFGF